MAEPASGRTPQDDTTEGERREDGPVKIHMFPPGFDLMGGPWAAVPLASFQIAGKVVVCLECGSAVAPDLMNVHEGFHRRLANV